MLIWEYQSPRTVGNLFTGDYARFLQTVGTLQGPFVTKTEKDISLEGDHYIGLG